MTSEVPPLTPPINRTSLPYHRRHPRVRHNASWRWAARWRRSLFGLLTVGQTLLATYFMVSVLPYHASTLVEKGLVVFFALSFAWISIGAWLGLFGFFFRLIGGDRHRLCRGVPQQPAASSSSRTALLMPLYHEPVDLCYAGLAAVYQSLHASGQGDRFDFFVLSDSNNESTIQQEKSAWRYWVDRLGAAGHFFYRNRRVSLRHKSGNITDFLRRWGANYEYFVILDADSLMDAATLNRMVAVMDAHPKAGIVQAPPSIVAARSRFARMQQFANALYGPLFSSGLAALQLGDGAYWGHNAIIRTQAFMAHCALPSLRGFGLFRGAILSHDFVEATYMRRGGYEVWLENDLVGSYEQSPPSLVDELGRDRRWARGNLQHAALVLSEHKLGIPQRLIFMNGIMAYVAAPVWLLFLVLSGIEIATFTLFPIDYFPGGHHLFPVWPEWHPEWAIRLASSTAVILFLPKVLALLDAFIRPTRRRLFGGGLALIASTLLETLLSVLLAPVRMLSHSRFVAEALLNLQLTWGGQNRDQAIGWFTALRMHGIGMLLGIGWGIFAWWLRPLYFYWSLPITLPLVLAPLLAVITSRIGNGKGGLLQTPLENEPPEVVHRWQADIGAWGKSDDNDNSDDTPPSPK